MILLDSRTVPSTERREIREGRIAIIVGIPEGVRRKVSGTAHNWTPLGSRRVNTNASRVHRYGSGNCLLQPSDVGTAVRVPRTGGFNVEPDHVSTKSTLHGIDGVLNLGSRVGIRVGEDVQIHCNSAQLVLPGSVLLCR